MVNAAVCQMFALHSDQVIGRPFGELFISFEGFDEFTQIVFDAVAERGKVARRVTRVRVRDSLRSLSITTSCLTVGEERVALIVVVSDITEVRELRETELRQADVIETQLGKLQNAYRDLEVRNEALSAMTRRVRTAHGIAIFFVLVLFLAIGTWYIRPLDLFSASAALNAVDPGIEANVPSTLPTFTATPREFSSTISLQGYLAPGQVAEVVSPIESHVSAIHAVPGEQVTEGAPLLDLDTGPLAAEHRRAQIEYIRKRDHLLELEDWENSADMWRARRALRRAKVTLDDAERSLRTTTFLLEQGLVPASQHDDAKRQRQDRTLDLEEAERELRATLAKGNDEAIQVAELEARTAEERLRAQEEKLHLAQIRAPIGGVVLAAEGTKSGPLTKGSSVQQGQQMLSIANLERLSVVTNIDEVDIQKLESGQRAWITGPGFPDLRIGGTVTQVASRARVQRRAPQFEVVVTLDKLDEEAVELVRVGMSAHITVVIYHRPEALLIPIGAIQQRDGNAWVQVVTEPDDTVEMRMVEIGLTTLDSVEVLEGLSAGDKVVLLR